jgi:fatty acid desaturase
MKFPNPFSYAVTFFLIARQQLALAILMHDAAHKRLFKSVRINDVVGQYLCAAPLLFSMYSYRKLHLKHHQAPLAEDDPDLSLIGGYPVSKSSFARKLARDTFGISYFKFIRYFIHMSRKTNKSNSPAIGAKIRVREDAPTVEIVTSIIVVNALIFLALTAAHHPWCYVSFWLLPAITALQVLLRIRGIAEHSGYQYNRNQMLSARTVRSSWQTFVFAPHSVNFHIEHHVYPSIPHHNLSKAHHLMREREILPESNLYAGYGQIVRELVK